MGVLEARTIPVVQGCAYLRSYRRDEMRKDGRVSEDHIRSNNFKAAGLARREFQPLLT